MLARAGGGQYPEFVAQPPGADLLQSARPPQNLSASIFRASGRHPHRASATPCKLLPSSFHAAVLASQWLPLTHQRHTHTSLTDRPLHLLPAGCHHHPPGARHPRSRCPGANPQVVVDFLPSRLASFQGTRRADPPHLLLPLFLGHTHLGLRHNQACPG